MRSLPQTLCPTLQGLRLGLIGLCLIGLSCLGLVGCQPSPSARPNVTHVTLWHGVNPAPNRDVLQKLVDRFNQSHPTIQVDSLYVGQADQQLPKLLAAVAGNAAPDMLWYAAMLTGQLVDLDALRPLDDWLPTVPEFQELDPALLETMRFEGKTWSIPFATNNVGVFYRPSLFKAAGITAPPQTWTEFRQVARQLTRDRTGDGRIDQHGMLLPLGKGEWSVFTWLPFLWSGGGELTSGGAIQVVSPGAIAALQFWQDLMNDGSAVLSAPERGYELDGFLAGNVAMQISGPWTLGQLQQSGQDFGAFPIPQQSRAATTIGGENLFVFKSVPEREQAALQFAQFVLSEEFQTAWATQTGYLPVNLKSRESAAYKAFRSQQPAVDMFLEQAKHGRSRPISPGYNRISENLGRAIEGTLLRQGTPEQMLTEAQKRINLIFR